ncbi:DNA-directed RNA polymerase subunit K [Candidatus Woesearchaeota archaeon CG_4_10_14_0_2_um_filter_57_5]|nr:MAG: DNA-directed RNA polymerase subunit K [Candidatus Woesearchaeota archaeon CG1_02_57_44]PIZ48736.1 MAG: DNA-directed RNA polymerase subunit K [Candidatus Woesearchaeota archaeon CG_4_10_14_0_2_um_filter_57_5]
MDLTKYEKARIIGARSLQLSMGAPPLVKMGPADLEKLGYDPLRIAELEFSKDVIPITVRRSLPKVLNDLRKTTDKPLVNF